VGCGTCGVDEVCIGHQCEVTCFPGDTGVTMADGSRRPIQEVAVGDSVQSYDSDTQQLVTSVVLETTHHPKEEVSAFVRVNGQLRLTPNHPVYTPLGAKAAGDLVVGDSIVSIDAHGAPVHDVVRSLERLPANEDVYDLRVGGPGDFIVDGVIVFIKP
jgi:hypothetical protein